MNKKCPKNCHGTEVLSQSNEGKNILKCNQCGYPFIEGEAISSRSNANTMQPVNAVEGVVLNAIGKRLAGGVSPIPLELQRDCKITIAATKKALGGLVAKGYIAWDERAMRSIQFTEAFSVSDRVRKNLKLIPASERSEPVSGDSF